MKTSAPHKLTRERLDELINLYDQPEIRLSKTYGDGGSESPWPRFERAALNQRNGGEAALSRYAIWANTVRDNIIAGIETMEAGDLHASKAYLVRAANSLSAFSHVQAYFDPMNMGGL